MNGIEAAYHSFSGIGYVAPQCQYRQMRPMGYSAIDSLWDSEFWSALKISA